MEELHFVISFKIVTNDKEPLCSLVRNDVNLKHHSADNTDFYMKY